MPLIISSPWNRSFYPGGKISLPGDPTYYPEMDRIPDAGFPIEGYIVRWEITGRGILHHAIQDNDREELSETLCTRLRQAMGTGSPFLWTESVGFRTAGACSRFGNTGCPGCAASQSYGKTTEPRARPGAEKKAVILSGICLV